MESSDFLTAVFIELITVINNYIDLNDNCV